MTKAITPVDAWTALLAIVDGDAGSEAVMDTVLQPLANRLQNLYVHKGWIDQANTWSHDNTFNGQSGDANAALKTTATPTNRKLLWEAETDGAAKCRIYAGECIEIVTNAEWNAGTSLWGVDSASLVSTNLKIGDASGDVLLSWRTAGAGTWADSAWGKEASLNAYVIVDKSYLYKTDASGTTVSTSSYVVTVVDSVDMTITNASLLAGDVVEVHASGRCDVNTANNMQIGLQYEEGGSSITSGSAVLEGGFFNCEETGMFSFSCRHTITTPGTLTVSMAAKVDSGNGSIDPPCVLFSTVYRAIK